MYINDHNIFLNSVYSIAAEKESFVFSRDANAKEYKFLARKLAEINVEVVDAQGETPLQVYNFDSFLLVKW